MISAFRASSPSLTPPGILRGSRARHLLSEMVVGRKAAEGLDIVAGVGAWRSLGDPTHVAANATVAFLALSWRAGLDAFMMKPEGTLDVVRGQGWGRGGETPHGLEGGRLHIQPSMTLGSAKAVSRCTWTF